MNKRTFSGANSAAPGSLSIDFVGATSTDTYSATVSFACYNYIQAVAAEAVSAINAVTAFTADGHYAVDNGDGTVTIQWASADTLSTQAATISAGTTGITMSGGTAGNALPVNNTSAEIAAVVASQLNTAFSDNKIFRTASNVAGSSAVTLTFRDNDGAALNTIMAGIQRVLLVILRQKILLQQQIFMLEE